MAKIIVQIGHVNGLSGATYEEETLKLIVPHVVARLRSAGHVVQVLDGSLQNESANYQYEADGCLFCHCDSNGGGSTYSIGYWEEVHPGSQALAGILQALYHLESGIAFGGFNITPGEALYYGNRRIAHHCKCNLLEFGFVSNPAQRQFLVNNAQRVGYAAADAYIRYFGGTPAPVKKQEDEMGMYDKEGASVFFGDCFVDKYNYYLHTNGESGNVVFHLLEHSSNTERASVAQGVSKHQLHDLQNVTRTPQTITKGSYALTCTADKSIRWTLREVPK